MEPDSYESAYEELQQLLHKIESGEVQVSSLADRVTRAGELLRFCQSKLRRVEQELEALYEEE